MNDDLIDLSDDFTFTFEGEQDKYQDELNERVKEYQTRLSLLHNAISQLLENLKRDPDKPMIKWPNRLQDIEKFEQKITEIIEGKE